MPDAPITPQAVRDYANLPSEVPEPLLTKHIKIAERDLVRATGVAGASDNQLDEWEEALIVRSLASVFPWLHTFALSGAAKVGKLEGSVEYRFLDADEADAAVTRLNARFSELVSKLTPTDTDNDAQEQVAAGGFWLASIKD